MKVNTLSTNEIVMLVREVAAGLRKKGFVPERTLTDYIRSGDPTYLNQLDNELKAKIYRIDPEELLDAILLHILY